VGFTDPPAKRGAHRSAKSFPGPTSCKTRQRLILLIKPGMEPHARTVCHVLIHRAQRHGQRDSDAPRHRARHAGGFRCPLGAVPNWGGEEGGVCWMPPLAQCRVLRDSPCGTLPAGTGTVQPRSKLGEVLGPSTGLLPLPCLPCAAKVPAFHGCRRQKASEQAGASR